jgi:hypothetical protein
MRARSTRSQGMRQPAVFRRRVTFRATRRRTRPDGPSRPAGANGPMSTYVCTLRSVYANSDFRVAQYCATLSNQIRSNPVLSVAMSRNVTRLKNNVNLLLRVRC